MQELLDLLLEEDVNGDPGPTFDSSGNDSQLCLFLSDSAVSGKESPKSMRLWG
jgi:hypothetical protein